jgi:pyridoxine kinase
VTVISIQSQVVHGHVGNSAAVFPLQACGIEVAAVPTTLLSNHPRYPSQRGQVLDANLVRNLLLGVKERGLVDACKVLITGYLGSAENAAIVIDFIRRAKARNPKLLYLCDPVMGDAGPGFYVNEDIRTLFCEGLVPLADIITPNQFELEHLVGRAPETVEEIVAAARGLGLSTVVVTGARLQGMPADTVQTLATNHGPLGWWRPPGFPASQWGPAICSGGGPIHTLGRAVSGVYGVLEETERRQSYEMALIASAGRMVRPVSSHRPPFVPTRMRHGRQPTPPAMLKQNPQ